MHCNGQKFSGAFEKVSFTSKFLGLKMQKKTRFFKDKMVFRVVFIKLHQTIEILLMVDFLRIFKNATFIKIFPDF